MNAYESSNGSRYHRRFYDAVRLYRNSDYEGALTVFSEIVVAVGQQDVNLSKYRSYEALTRVCLGDKNAVELCRELASVDFDDIEVHYNLALAEHKLGFRRRAVLAAQRGIAIDPGHPELRRLRTVMGLRRQPPIGFLGRDNVVNKWLGKLSYSKNAKSSRL
jgi:tetratricopeptide (TPR) repeat protein